MHLLEIKLLGQFECSAGYGGPVPQPTSQAQLLLGCLALAPGLRHRRERLAGFLGSAASESQAISAIRKSIGDGADLALRADRKTVSLQPGLVDIDALEFERLVVAGDYQSLVTAAGLYRGEFLEGVTPQVTAGQDWLDHERKRFRSQFIEILRNLSETGLVTRDYPAAVRAAERLVQQQPLQQAGWRLLMRAFDESGHPRRALQAFERCREILLTRFHTEPEEATLELRARISEKLTR